MLELDGFRPPDPELLPTISPIELGYFPTDAFFQSVFTWAPEKILNNAIPAEVGVTGFEIGVVGFSRSSIFLAEGVLALLLVPLLGEGGGTSFFTWPLRGTEDGPNLSRPFSRGDAVPFAAGLVGPSLASSTTRSWSLFSPSLCCSGRSRTALLRRTPRLAEHGAPMLNTYMAYVLVLLLLHLLPQQMFVLRIGCAARPVLLPFRRRYRISLQQRRSTFSV